MYLFRRAIIYIFFITCVIYSMELGSGIAKAKSPYIENHDSDIMDLSKEISNILHNECKGNGCSKFKKAVLIRNYIYNNSNISNDAGVDFFKMTDTFLALTKYKSIGLLCAGFAVVYATALESQGIPARYVGILSSDKTPYESHATIEFWDNGRWYASDPTFNIMYSKNGKYISYAELYRLIKYKINYKITSNGFKVKEKRSIYNYYINNNELIKYMVIHPAIVRWGGKTITYPMQLFPRGWKGDLTNVEKDFQRSVVNFGGIYKYLYTGPLR